MSVSIGPHGCDSPNELSHAVRVWESHRCERQATHPARERLMRGGETGVRRFESALVHMLKMKALSDGKTVLWDTSNPHETAVVYTPRPDKNERLYNSQ
ncbi:hypothetical protein HATV-3_gp21 [Haloarcula tailed virus 3]|uniref:Uncharacterized protein n=1 Tax=Haloarcula tailed virus 3 TaxID=2877990 RepID=A0AAE8XZI7_9CAUD|nr:hypothetical protein M1M35_gp21 [Haloarcula tailed virus 3]UBF23371.1 hypothetical protein HATV-3_gp21 [Haloarcula tailed virus 3]